MRLMRASSASDSEYSSLRSRNSRTYGSLMLSATVRWLSGCERWPLRSISSRSLARMVRSKNCVLIWRESWRTVHPPRSASFS